MLCLVSDCPLRQFLSPNEFWLVDGLPPARPLPRREAGEYPDKSLRSPAATAGRLRVRAPASRSSAWSNTHAQVFMSLCLLQDAWESEHLPPEAQCDLTHTLRSSWVCVYCRTLESEHLPPEDQCDLTHTLRSSWVCGDSRNDHILRWAHSWDSFRVTERTRHDTLWCSAALNSGVYRDDHSLPESSEIPGQQF